MAFPDVLKNHLDDGNDICLDNGAELLDPDEWEDIESQFDDFEWDCPRLSAIAVDGGAGWFFLDQDGEWGGPKGAVWWTDRVYIGPEHGFVAAESFAAFVAMSLDEVDDRWAPA